MTSRRNFIATAGLGVGAIVLGDMLLRAPKPAVAGPTAKFPMNLTDEQWHKRLTPAQYDILREAGTERAFTSPLNDEHRGGVFSCAGCEQKAFASETKFDSGTGWPSFLPAAPEGGRRDDGPFVRIRAHRGSLRQLRRPSRPRLRRRPAPHGLALLHERHRDEIHNRLSPSAN